MSENRTKRPVQNPNYFGFWALTVAKKSGEWERGKRVYGWMGGLKPF